MPKLGKKAELKKLVLPSSTPEDEAYVVVKDTLLMEDIVGAGADVGDDLIDKTASAIARVIVEWNFVEEDGQVAPINASTVRRMDYNDYMYIMTNTKALNDSMQLELKKRGLSLSTSPQNGTETVQEITHA